MPDIDLAIKNFEKQDKIFTDPTRLKIVVKGRRFGLTRGAANDLIRGALAYQYKKGLWVDTVNANIDRYVERYFLPHLMKLPQDQWNWRKQSKILEIAQSYIDFRSADRPENLEGFGYDKFFLNEAGIILKNEYIWHNAIQPMLWEYKADGVIGGTPKGKGLFFELAQRGKDPEQKDFAYYHYSSFDSPYLNIEALEKDMASMPEAVVRQEIYAEFLDDTGVVFRNFKGAMTAHPRKPEAGHLYVMGVDLAKVQDFTVVTVYDRKDNSQVYQDRYRTLEWPYQKQKLYSIAKHYNNALIYMDATGVGDPIADDLIRAGLAINPVKLTNESKKEIIEKLAIWLEQRRCSLLPIPETIEEFTNFTYDVTSTGRIRYEAPVGFHDDIVISHALAIWGLNQLIRPDRPQEISSVRQDYMRDKLRYEQEDIGDSYDY